MYYTIINKWVMVNLSFVIYFQLQKIIRCKSFMIWKGNQKEIFSILHCVHVFSRS